jgi:hypothetical protein
VPRRISSRAERAKALELLENTSFAPANQAALPTSLLVRGRRRDRAEIAVGQHWISS